jgi:hypothetical protein
VACRSILAVASAAAEMVGRQTAKVGTCQSAAVLWPIGECGSETRRASEMVTTRRAPSNDLTE